jgi:magnesium transporter
MSASIIHNFEDAISILPVLVAFIPIRMGTGGNAGSQASTLIIRGMAVGEIQMGDVLRVLWREIRIAVICGIALSVVNFTRVYLMNDKDIVLATTVTLSLFATLIIAKSVGGLLPIIARKCKVDPAVMAAPLITTIVDCAALLVYFSVAKLFFNI